MLPSFSQQEGTKPCLLVFQRRDRLVQYPRSLRYRSERPRLRELSRDPIGRRIETIRRVGYGLDRDRLRLHESDCR